MAVLKFHVDMPKHGQGDVRDQRVNNLSHKPWLWRGPYRGRASTALWWPAGGGPACIQPCAVYTLMP